MDAFYMHHSYICTHHRHTRTVSTEVAHQLLDHSFNLE
jgi:hypothetical protein